MKPGIAPKAYKDLKFERYYKDNKMPVATKQEMREMMIYWKKQCSRIYQKIPKCSKCKFQIRCVLVDRDLIRLIEGVEK